MHRPLWVNEPQDHCEAHTPMAAVGKREADKAYRQPDTNARTSTVRWTKQLWDSWKFESNR